MPRLGLPQEAAAGASDGLRQAQRVASDFTDITSQLFPTRVGGYTLTGVTSLGQDARGEIYITTLGGDVFKIRGGRR